jgi:hypothetical protein
VTESDRETMLRTIEDFERTVAEFRRNSVVHSTTVLLRRLEEIGVSATALGDRILNAMIEKMRRELTTGKGLDGQTYVRLLARLALLSEQPYD